MNGQDLQTITEKGLTRLAVIWEDGRLDESHYGVLCAKFIESWKECKDGKGRVWDLDYYVTVHLSDDTLYHEDSSF